MKTRLPGHIPDGVLLDEADRIALSVYRWSIDGHGYVQRHERLGVGKYTKVKMHVQVMGEIHVDHINGNRLDNRRENLRIIDHQGNCQNIALTASNTSGHRGVSWNKRMQKWYAYGVIDRRMISLGFHDDLEDAARIAREFREKNYRGYVDRSPA